MSRASVVPHFSTRSNREIVLRVQESPASGGLRGYAVSMMSVEQAVRALRRDVLAALATEAPLPGGALLVADRVSFSLGVCFEPPEIVGAEPGCLVVATEPVPELHRITLEFRVVTPSAHGALSSASPPALPAGPQLQGPEPRSVSVFEMLAEVFGPPGFDSAARATVFREALDALTEAQRLHVLTTLNVSAHSEEEAVAVRHARQLVRRLAASGPAGQERGSDLLRQLATQVTVGELMAVAAQRWETQSAWATKPRAED